MEIPMLSSRYIKEMDNMFHEEENKKSTVLFVVESPRDAAMWSHFFQSLNSTKYNFIAKLPCHLPNFPDDATGCQAIRDLTVDEKKAIFGPNLIAILDSDYRFILSTLHNIPFPLDNYIYETHLHSAENFYFHPNTLWNFFKKENLFLDEKIFSLINQITEDLNNNIYESLLAEIFLRADKNINKIGCFSMSEDFEKCFVSLACLNRKPKKEQIAEDYITTNVLNLNNIQEIQSVKQALKIHEIRQLHEIVSSGNKNLYDQFKTQCIKLGITPNHSTCFIQGHFYESILHPIAQLLATIFKKANEKNENPRIHAEINNTKNQISNKTLLSHIKYENIPLFYATLTKIKEAYV